MRKLNFREKYLCFVKKSKKHTKKQSVVMVGITLMSLSFVMFYNNYVYSNKLIEEPIYIEAIPAAIDEIIDSKFLYSMNEESSSENEKASFGEKAKQSYSNDLPKHTDTTQILSVSAIVYSNDEEQISISRVVNNDDNKSEDGDKKFVEEPVEKKFDLDIEEEVETDGEFYEKADYATEIIDEEAEVQEDLVKDILEKDIQNPDELLEELENLVKEKDNENVEENNGEE